MGFGMSMERASLAMSQLGSPDRESFHIGMARLAYIEGWVDCDEFEVSVAWVLKGGTVGSDGRATWSGAEIDAQRNLPLGTCPVYRP
jgi:hypothetical protein